MIRNICQGVPPHFNQLSSIRHHFRTANHPGTEIVAAWHDRGTTVHTLVVTDQDVFERIRSLLGRRTKSLTFFVDTDGTPDLEEYQKRIPSPAKV